MRPSQFFLHCPRCGGKQPHPPTRELFVCGACEFTLYFSSANATAAFVSRDDGRVLLIRRAKEPAQGKLAPPGGFIDVGETAESAVRREIREEVGLELTHLRFLCSQPNQYFYKNVTYPVLDFFFTARAVAPEQARAMDDVAGLVWLKEDEIRADELAFPSMQAAWHLHRLGVSGPDAG